MTDIEGCIVDVENIAHYVEMSVVEFYKEDFNGTKYGV